jgi:hypothetical protein
MEAEAEVSEPHIDFLLGAVFTRDGEGTTSQAAEKLCFARIVGRARLQSCPAANIKSGASAPEVELFPNERLLLPKRLLERG